jgi:hypothetical protein
MPIQLLIAFTNIFIPLEDSQRLFTFSVNHPQVSSSPLAETISGFWQLYYVVLQLPSDLVQIHLHRWICSEQIWTARICAPRSTVGIGFRSPLAILPLSKRGGGGSGIGRASLERPGLECPDQRRSSDSGPSLPFCL